MRTINFIGFLFLIMVGFYLYGISEKGPYIYQNNETHNIKINRDFFEPNDITINLGDQVVWKNHDYVLRHTVVCDDPLLRNSDVLLKGEEFKIIFDRPGDYVFYSSLYPQYEKGIIRVREVARGSEFRENLRTNIIDAMINLYRVLLKTSKRVYHSVASFVRQVKDYDKVEQKKKEENPELNKPEFPFVLEQIANVRNALPKFQILPELPKIPIFG